MTKILIPSLLVGEGRMRGIDHWKIGYWDLFGI